MSDKLYSLSYVSLFNARQTKKFIGLLQQTIPRRELCDTCSSSILINATEQFGQIAHAFSTYEARHSPDDAKPFQRGINSIQLMNDGKRWWVVTIFWQGEDEKSPLPEKYLRER